MRYAFILILSLISTGCLAQSVQKIPIVKSTKPIASVRIDSVFYKDRWSISPTARPDVFDLSISGDSSNITFVTDIDSISVNVKPGEKFSFVILLNGRDSAFTEIQGIIKPAHFTNDYKKANNGKILTEIPEVYELVNILFALTPTYQKDTAVVSRYSPYYQSVISNFKAFMKEPAVMVIDSLARAGRYFDIKMDAYAFNFDSEGQISRSAIYDRISWGRSNSLLPYIDYLQRFAIKSGFQNFYRENRPIYETQVAVYRDSLNVGEMVQWLNKNFPTTRYNVFKIIWSPLVGNNQSANWFTDGKFMEMQAHVNFPYNAVTQLSSISPKSNLVKRGDIVFTEINHSFINPEGEKDQYIDSINYAFSDLQSWAEGIAFKGYGNPYLCFNEYMNWGLVSLRYVDYADVRDLESLLVNLELRMTQRRGFRRFSDFNRFLINIYRNRKPGSTISELYPQIVSWFVKNK